MDSESSFARRRPPKFSEPIDFSQVIQSTLNINDNFYVNKFFVGDDTKTSWSSGLMDNHQPLTSFASTSNYWNWNDLSPSPWTPIVNHGISSGTIGTSPDQTVDSFEQSLQGSIWLSGRTNFWKNQINKIGDISNYGRPISDYIASDSGELLENLKLSQAPINTVYRPIRSRRRQPSCVECVFCKNNGEPEEKFKSHILKDPEGIILCPILRAYNCPICRNGGGNYAHTVRYCPKNRPGGWHKAALIKNLAESNK